MTLKKENQSFGIPDPVTKLTYEQDLHLRVLHDKLQENFADRKEEIITLLIALQHQNFVLGNSLSNLVKKWPNEENLSIPTGERIQIKIRPQK